MSALGQYLLERGWIDQNQLTEALLHQQDAGGRIGTCLLERGFLDEDHLLAALSAQQGAPMATAEDLAGIGFDVIGLLAPDVASRHLAVPFRAAGTRLDIALARVDNLAQLDELSFVVGRTLRPHIATEARLFACLETYYEVPCPRRFRVLIDALDHGDRAPRRVPGPLPAPAAASAGPRPAGSLDRPGPRRRIVPELRPPQNRSIPLTDEQRRALQPTVVESSAPLPERLALAGTPDEIARLLLGSLDNHFVRTLLFRVNRGTVSGWLGHGPGIDRDWLAGYSVGVRQATVFREVEDGTVFRGRLASVPAHESLARCWGGGLEHECLVAAVRVRGKMVAALYGDRGPLGLGGLDGDEVERLRGKAGLAFERLILDRKLRG